VDLVERLRSVCREVSTDPEDLAGSTRDQWAMAAQVAQAPEAVARPAGSAEVAAVLAVCSEAGVPVTPAGGRSGVCGGAVPVHGGVVLDVRGVAGVVCVDRTSLLVDVGAGTFGDVLEAELRETHGFTLGHRPQSLRISTVGGWLACRSAGQYSTRYGKIEDMVAGLDVALADGRVIRTGGAPRAATGPDLTQVFVGSEGTLGVITAARLRVRPAPTAEGRAAYGFDSFTEGVETCRRILQRGATPAVLRLYDTAEAARAFDHTGALLVVLDEADPVVVDATLRVVGEEAASGGHPLGPEPVDRWMASRDDAYDVEALARQGIVGDTMEVAAFWSALVPLYERVTTAVRAVPGTVWVSAHLSHAYGDGACLYFSLAGQGTGWYVPAWDAAAAAVLAAGGAVSHHHGIGLAKARFLPSGLGSAHGVLVDLKHALDPAGVLNPGKLSLPDPFGDVGWPTP
jgi:alkyldihydroxyacetonephosphate synthase